MELIIKITILALTLLFIVGLGKLVFNILKAVKYIMEGIINELNRRG